MAISLLQEFLGDKAELFVHELVSFARSPLSMNAYDSTVQYDDPQSSLGSSSSIPAPAMDSPTVEEAEHPESVREGDPLEEETPRKKLKEREA
ncbi:hypothetical protein HK098_006848 [Nowakowskiella sp. JEL0407]|nr:hypothetical protein HK098_006848 [Nowakowskiella sp. JEL0407]